MKHPGNAKVVAALVQLGGDDCEPERSAGIGGVQGFGQRSVFSGYLYRRAGESAWVVVLGEEPRYIITAGGMVRGEQG